MTNHLISLTVGTEGAEEWFRAFQDLSELANNLGTVHHYVSVSSSAVGNEESDPIDDDVYYDDNTMVKVREALVSTLSRLGSGTSASQAADAVILELQNAGILFRERR
jgi:hypothetical protein